MSLTKLSLHCKQKLRDSWIFFDQTFLGLGLGKLFPDRKSLVSDIPSGDRNIADLFYSVGGNNVIIPGQGEIGS